MSYLRRSGTGPCHGVRSGGDPPASTVPYRTVATQGWESGGGAAVHLPEKLQGRPAGGL